MAFQSAISVFVVAAVKSAFFTFPLRFILVTPIFVQERKKDLKAKSGNGKIKRAKGVSITKLGNIFREL